MPAFLRSKALNTVANLAVSAALAATFTSLQAQTAPADPAAAASYANHCAICHGDQREGILPGFPPLAGIEHRLKDDQILSLIRQGKGRMPAFPKLPSDEVATLIHYLDTAPSLIPTIPPSTSGGGGNPYHQQLTGEAATGGALFLQNCAFCHGRDAMGGETGPDLTQSKLVLADTDGTKITEVVRQGRLEKKMPAFNFSTSELTSLVAFIRAREAAAAAMGGKRRGVEPADLQTGNAQQGQHFFAANCSTCHSPVGDLAGIARKYQGLELEQRMLYPRDAWDRVTVTLPNGHQLQGGVEYRDEFTLGMRDTAGNYHSWQMGTVHFKIVSAADAHIDLFPKYTDDDVHNLMAYLQTLR